MKPLNEVSRAKLLAAAILLGSVGVALYLQTISAGHVALCAIGVALIFGDGWRREP